MNEQIIDITVNLALKYNTCALTYFEFLGISYIDQSMYNLLNLLKSYQLASSSNFPFYIFEKKSTKIIKILRVLIDKI